MKIPLANKSPKIFLTLFQKLIGFSRARLLLSVSLSSVIETSGSFSPMAKENLILTDKSWLRFNSSEVGTSLAPTVKLLKSLFIPISRDPKRTFLILSKNETGDSTESSFG